MQNHHRRAEISTRLCSTCSCAKPPRTPWVSVAAFHVVLFETLADHGLATVNLLHSHGALQVGRHAEILGPGDRRRPLARYRSARPLDAIESALLGGLVDESTAPFLEEMAADFDLLERLAEDEATLDLITLRVASLDLLTHARFRELQNTGQDDGDLLLYRTYRLIDHRLRKLQSRLGAGDVLIVMSDHGIRTPLEHDERALFLALGPGVEPGRNSGTPPIQEVSGWIAELLGVAVEWPGTGPKDWIRPPASEPGAGPSSSR